MRASNVRSSSSRSAATPKAVPADRRSRTRLRDLCDEVLASFRMARQADPFSEEERAEGRALVSMVARQAR